MSILVDARWRGPHGIGRFAAEVLNRLPGCDTVGTTLPLLHPLEPLWLSIVARRRRPSVYFSPGFNPPWRAGCPVVFVIHDLIHLKGPAEAGASKLAYYERIVKPAALCATRLLTVSESSKNDIVEWLRIPADCVEVVGNGVSRAFHSSGARRRAEEPYFLFVGNGKPHKNFARVAEAFRVSSLNRTAKLIVVGIRPDGAFPDGDPLYSGVRFMGELADADIAALYRGAVCLVAPSLIEGFCLPALEAMACGCPVIAGDGPAQREVIGDAGVFVRPTVPDEIADAMRSILSSPSSRDTLIQLGLKRAAAFSWDDTAARVQRALREAAGGSL